jgi:hypothetical protein
MLDAIVYAVWIVSAAVFAWMLWDFVKINLKYGEDTLISSREGVDDLFGGSDTSHTVGGSKP